MKSWPALLAVLLLAHVAFGLLRVPNVTVARRLREVAEYRRDGDIAYTMRAAHMPGAEVLAELRARTPADCDVAMRGDSKGPLEFAAALLWPRLLFRSSSSSSQPPRRGARSPHALVADERGLHLDPP